MARLLVVHHTPSPTVEELLHQALEGAGTDAIEDVDVATRPALGATVSDVLDADGYLLVTPANLGYMSGALKHFFDTIYYPCLDATRGRPYGLLVHGNNDVDGAIVGVERIVTGLAWRAVSQPVKTIGDPTPEDRTACWELGATVAASLQPDS
ncbi:MAG: hypothetical protein ABI239_02405 [Aquihabitans sp.]